VGAPRVVYFTAGTTGAGHLARAFAIERALARAGSKASFTTIGPPSTLRLGGRASDHAVTIDPLALSVAARAEGSALARLLRDLSPEVLLVDLFWAPLRHLLPLPGCEAWLLVRRAPAKWFVGPPGLPFDRGAFARVVGIEPGLDEAPASETIAPIVALNPDELRPDRALHEALGVARGEDLHVIHQAGEPHEWRSLLQTRAERPVHVFAPGLAAGDGAAPGGVHLHDGEGFFPLAQWLSGAATITCGAGYNAFWEARWLGHARRTTFVPFRRNIDDQAWRLRACAEHVPRDNGADVLARWLC
jgi:hypothetical protein